MNRLLLTILFAYLSLGALTTTAQDETLPPAPGELFDVGDHQLHLYCSGEGSPTVMIETGLASWSIQWWHVQEAISTFTRVCTYDRAGYGWSSIGPEPRTSQQVADEFTLLLEAAEIETPIVLVGHSFGALTAQLFANQHPELTAALVLIDGPNPYVESTLPQEWNDFSLELYEDFPSYAEFAEQGMIPPESIEIPANLPEGIHSLYQQQLATPEFFRTAYAEISSFSDSIQQVADSEIAFGELPLFVIGRGLPVEIPTIPNLSIEISSELGALVEADNATQQEALAQLSTRGVLITAETSSHDVQYTEPEVIVEAVQAAIQAIDAAQ
jgi:pimeloyl-ACP methyl ester carboxylesterase